MSGDNTNSNMMQQAQQIWSMLDDMASTDPEAYKKFLDKQMREHKEMTSPPLPNMCVKMSVLEPKKEVLFVNFCSWQRVPAPKSDNDPIPVIGTPLQKSSDKNGSFLLTSCVFHPTIITDFGKNSKNIPEQEALIHLAMQYTEDQQGIRLSRNYTIQRDIEYKGDFEAVQKFFTNSLDKDKRFDKDFNELQNKFAGGNGVSNESLLERITNMSVSGDNMASDTGVGQKIEDTIKLPGSERTQNSKVLIEEVHATGNSSDRCPKHSMVRQGGDRGEVVIVTIELPGVMSVTECELDISEDELSLVVPDRYDLQLTFPVPVCDSEAKAKFFKKLQTLTVTMPVKS